MLLLYGREGKKRLKKGGGGLMCRILGMGLQKVRVYSSDGYSGDSVLLGCLGVSFLLYIYTYGRIP